MTEPEKQKGHLPRSTSSRATSGASLGLAGVVICLAAFSIFGAYTTQTRVDRARELDARQEGFSRAASAVNSLARAELEYHLGATAKHRAELSEATDALIVLVHEAAALGDENDRQLAREIAVLHDQFLASTTRLVTAVAVGDAAEAVRIDEVEFQPILETMRVLLTAEADRGVAEVDSAFLHCEAPPKWC